MKKSISVIAGSVLLIISLLTCLNINKADVHKEENDVPEVTHRNMLSMMLETDSGSGEYTLETRSSWPTKEDGYIFNSTLSKCENGSKLSWDDENNAVIMVGATSDKCYVYFDVYVEPTITLADYVKSQYTGVQGENNLYYHDSTLANGAGDNSYRYAGSSDTTNNFVCFGSDASTCPDDNLYRIIGVFGDKVKLIKWDYATSELLGTDGDYNGTCSASNFCFDGINNNTYKGSNIAANIGAYCWNYNNASNTYNTTNYYNFWSYSKLNTVNLNTNFLKNIRTVWANKIATTTWKVGGNTYANISNTKVTNVYKNEYVNPAENTTYTDKVGLMYVSDYGYAANLSSWTTNLNSYNTVASANWMYMGLYEWTEVRRSDNSSYSFFVNYTGAIGNDDVNNSFFSLGIRPVFYLNSDVTIVGENTGSKSNPIRID